MAHHTGLAYPHLPTKPGAGRLKSIRTAYRLAGYTCRLLHLFIHTDMLTTHPREGTLNPDTNLNKGGLAGLLARPFSKAVLLYAVGSVVALLPVWGEGGDWNAALKRFGLVSASVAVFFVITLFFNRPSSLKWLAVGLVGVMALVAIFGTAQVKTDAYTLRLNGFNYQVYTLLRKLIVFKGLPEVNQNVLGNFLIAFLPLALAFVVWGRGWLWRGYFGVCSLLTATAVLVTASRSSLIGLLALFFVFALFLTARRPRLSLLVVASLVVAGVGGTVFILMTGFTNIESGASRWELWRSVTGLVGDYPLTGGGLGQFENHFLKYATPGIYAYPQPHAHNIFLQSWAEFGLAGFIAIMLTLASAVGLLVQHHNLQKLAPDLRPVVAGSICGVVVLFISGLLEYGAWGGKFAPAFWILPAMLAASGLRLAPIKLPARLGQSAGFSRLSTLACQGKGRWLAGGVIGLLALGLVGPLVLINTAKLLDSPTTSSSLYQAASQFAFWNPVPLRNLGRLADQQGNPGEALYYYKEALERDPADWLTLIPLGDLLERERRHDKAVAYWRQAQAAPYYIQLSRNYIQKTPPQYGPAEVYMKLAIDIDPHYDEAIQFLVGIYMATDRQPEAMAFLARMVAENQDPFLYHEAAVWAATDEQRIDFLQKALRLDPKNASYYWELGKAYQSSQQPEAAKKAYTESLALNPAFQPSVRSLGALYLSQGQPAEAIKLLEKFIGNTLFAEKPDPEYVLLAQAYFALKNNSAALTATQKALSYNPGASQAYLVQGNIFAANGDKEKAEEAYQKVLQLDPNNDQARKALARL